MNLSSFVMLNLKKLPRTGVKPVGRNREPLGWASGAKFSRNRTQGRRRILVALGHLDTVLAASKFRKFSSNIAIIVQLGISAMAGLGSYDGPKPQI